MAKVPKRSSEPNKAEPGQKETWREWLGRKYRQGEAEIGPVARLGLEESRNALFTDSNIAVKSTPYGIWGTRTPQEITDSRRADEGNVYGRLNDQATGNPDRTADQPATDASKQSSDGKDAEDSRSSVYGRDSILSRKMREARDRSSDPSPTPELDASPPEPPPLELE